MLAQINLDISYINYPEKSLYIYIPICKVLPNMSFGDQTIMLTRWTCSFQYLAHVREFHRFLVLSMVIHANLCNLEEFVHFKINRSKSQWNANQDVNTKNTFSILRKCVKIKKNVTNSSLAFQWSCLSFVSKLPVSKSTVLKSLTSQL